MKEKAFLIFIYTFSLLVVALALKASLYLNRMSKIVEVIANKECMNIKTNCLFCENFGAENLLVIYLDSLLQKKMGDTINDASLYPLDTPSSKCNFFLKALLMYDMIITSVRKTDEELRATLMVCINKDVLVFELIYDVQQKLFVGIEDRENIEAFLMRIDEKGLIDFYLCQHR